MNDSRRKLDPPGDRLIHHDNYKRVQDNVKQNGDRGQSSAETTIESIVNETNDLTVSQPPATTLLSHSLIDGSNDLVNGSNPSSSDSIPISRQPSDIDSEVATSSTSSPSTFSTVPPVKHGAYFVIKVRQPGTTLYKVQIPATVQPGSVFTVEVPEKPPNGSSNSVNNEEENNSNVRRVEVACPTEDVIPGTTEIEIAVPHAATYFYYNLKAAQLTIAPTTPEADGGRAFPMTEKIKRINQAALDSGGTIRTKIIVIPDGIIPGKTFYHPILRTGSNGKTKIRQLKIQCPLSSQPGDRIRIELPPELPEPEPLYQTFAVVVPEGVVAGGRFAVEIGHNNHQVLVQCPDVAKPGDTITIQLPTRTVVDQIDALSYLSTGSGWKRAINPVDLHFQWVRLHESVVESSALSKGRSLNWKSYQKLAYVRHLRHLEGNDPRLRTAAVTLEAAENVSVHSKLKSCDGEILFSYADIAYLQTKSLDEKHLWFFTLCQKLRDSESTSTDFTIETITKAVNSVTIAPGSNLSQNIRLLIRRDHLLSDSLRAVLSLSAVDMRRSWEIEFVGERGIGFGLEKEWFQCVTEKLFDPTVGLFVCTVNNQAAVDVNPTSCRVIGRALFSGNLIKGHICRLLLKHLLGWPLTIEDIRDQDEDYYRSLRQISEMDDDTLTSLSLNFAVVEEYGSAHICHELIENGSKIDVCRNNLSQFIDKRIQYHLFGRILPQLTELLLGFYDVVPEQALTIFDASELELVLCGLPQLDVNDWKLNTVYMGLYESSSENDIVIQWFWEVVEDEFDAEMKARLLQFVTATSGVPPGGFSSLMGYDGSPRKFTIQGVDPSSCLYPRAHACFNMLDLPKYTTKNELLQRLKFSITTSFVGFEAE